MRWPACRQGRGGARNGRVVPRCQRQLRRWGRRAQQRRGRWRRGAQRQAQRAVQGMAAALRRRLVARGHQLDLAGARAHPLQRLRLHEGRGHRRAERQRQPRQHEADQQAKAARNRHGRDCRSGRQRHALPRAGRWHHTAAGHITATKTRFKHQNSLQPFRYVRYKLLNYEYKRNHTMSKSLRLSEKWFRRGLWLVALVFASFLIGLGGTIVGDLPQVESQLELDDFLDRPQAQLLRAQLQTERSAAEAAQTALEQAQLQRDKARGEVQSQREGFNNWLAARSVTQRAEDNPEVLVRTRALDALQAAEQAQRRAVQAQQQAALDARQAAAQTEKHIDNLESGARTLMQEELRRVELRVFLYRLALTLPLLAIAGWLFVKKRQSTYWPFVWGFVFFALFAFFVELVPYLPSYGGYVRYVVGIGITALVGRYAILALNRYLERQKLAEALPDQERRKELSYDVALARLAKSVCPGCERPVDLKNPEIDFCPHCGIGLFDHCGHCSTRKSAFAKFCHACGCGAKVEPKI